MTPDATTPDEDESEQGESDQRAASRETEALALFASVVSHDLSNPLELGRVRRNAAQQTLSALRSELADADVDAELDTLETHLEKIATAQDRMRELLTDARSLTEHGPGTDPAPVSLSDTARAAWDTLATDDATLVVEDDWTLVADESRLRQLFENLYRNALEHADGEVTIRVGTLAADTDAGPVMPTDGDTETESNATPDTDADPAGFYVADDGPGIPAEDRDHVFELGYTTAENGTGFGLAIVAEITKRHDWTIDVTESRQGGARFEVTVE